MLQAAFHHALAPGSAGVQRSQRWSSSWAQAQKGCSEAGPHLCSLAAGAHTRPLRTSAPALHWPFDDVMPWGKEKGAILQLLSHGSRRGSAVAKEVAALGLRGP